MMTMTPVTTAETVPPKAVPPSKAKPQQRSKRNTPEQIVAKLRDADAMLNSGKDVAAVLK